jgi:hypothetical protein
LRLNDKEQTHVLYTLCSAQSIDRGAQMKLAVNSNAMALALLVAFVHSRTWRECGNMHDPVSYRLIWRLRSIVQCSALPCSCTRSDEKVPSRLVDVGNSCRKLQKVANALHLEGAATNGYPLRNLNTRLVILL